MLKKIQQKMQADLSAINEYEREPVPQKEVKSFKSFVNMVAGEHIAGTEFVIGPLFVLHGVAAVDVLVGLLVGNLLATLSWTLVCAPAAVKTRLTNFFLLEKICGRKLVNVYNAVNGLQSCVLAASMIGVSASAIGLAFNMPLPGFADILPNSWQWIVLCIALGLVIALVATYGYDRVARFSAICAPWMPLVFIAAAVAVMPQLGVEQWSDFWQVAQTKIWTGTVAAEGITKYTVWHIIFFAWLCNTAMHIGMGDMSIYRYAKKPWYGVASAAGMYIGHGMAWLASGVLCAVALQMGNNNPSPGQIAFFSAGIAGVVCVVFAGWTTANPTIYRAGLALKGILPNVARWRITMIVGVVAALLSCFPGVVSRLDNILAFYALVAAPIGAVIILDIYVLPRMNLRSNYAEQQGLSVNWMVVFTWASSVAFGYWLYQRLHADFFFFVAIPGWFFAALVYLLLNKMFQKKAVYPQTVPAHATLTKV